MAFFAKPVTYPGIKFRCCSRAAARSDAGNSKPGVEIEFQPDNKSGWRVGLRH